MLLVYLIFSIRFMSLFLAILVHSFLACFFV